MAITSAGTGDPVTVPAQLLLAFMAGRIPLLNFARQFGWADSETDVQNPFLDRARDGYQIASAEIAEDEDGMSLITFHFKPRS